MGHFSKATSVWGAKFSRLRKGRGLPRLLEKLRWSPMSEGLRLLLRSETLSLDVAARGRCTGPTRSGTWNLLCLRMRQSCSTTGDASLSLVIVKLTHGTALAMGSHAARSQGARSEPLALNVWLRLRGPRLCRGDCEHSRAPLLWRPLLKRLEKSSNVIKTPVGQRE